MFKKNQPTRFSNFSNFITPGLDLAINDVYRPETPPKNYFDAVKSNIPTLIISRKYDPVCFPLFANIISKTLVNCIVMIVPSASHAVFYAYECTRNIGAIFFLHPEKKPGMGCLSKRKQIDFVTTGIVSLLKNK